MNSVMVDKGIIMLANIFNLLVVGVFLSRSGGLRGIEWILGIIIALIALPVTMGIIVNVTAKRDWWTYVLPTHLVLYCLLEFILDYVIKVDFRNTGFLWFYLILFYIASLGMIGYSFGVSRLAGFITLGTYLLGLLASWYSYSKIGHG